MPDPWKNQCKKRRAFRYHIFRILVSIWKGFGLQNASQNHTLGTKMLGRSSFWAVLAAVFPQNGVLEDSEVDFGALGNRFGRLWGQLFWYFASFLSMFVSIFCIIWTNFPHEFLAAWTSSVHLLRDHCFPIFFCPELQPPVGLGGIAKRKQFVVDSKWTTHK